MLLEHFEHSEEELALDERVEILVPYGELTPPILPQERDHGTRGVLVFPVELDVENLVAENAGPLELVAKLLLGNVE